MKSTTHALEPEEVMAYLDGELAAERAATVSTHIEQCGECAALAAQLRGVSARMAEWQVEPAPETMDSAIRVASPAASASSRHHAPFSFAQFVVTRPRWVWPLVGASAVVLLLVSASTIGLLRAPAYDVVATKPQAALAVGAESKQKRLEGDALPRPELSFGDLFESARTANAAKELAKARGPMVIRTASVTLETKQFDATRAAIERIVRSHGGHVGQLQTAAPLNEARTLTATLRIPADRMDAALGEIKKLGRVTRESQGSDEVTEPYTDLVARLANSRHTEQRLVEILRTRTGKVEEVLEVEREIASVREGIERMEAQRKSLENRVSLSTVSLELREEFEKKISVAPPSTGTMLWNAMAEGLDGAFETVLALALFLLRAGPSLLLWAALLFLPARSVWRRMRANAATAA
jgi:hypothetical protein